MTEVLLDTNVAVVANNRDDAYSPDCALKCVQRLSRAMDSEAVILDAAGEILAEYKNCLNSNGAPGVGDAFYLHLLRHVWVDEHTVMVDLVKHHQRGFEAFPDDKALEKFDRADRKFAAAARLRKVPVVNAVDSDWRDSEANLARYDIAVDYVCGRDAAVRPTKRG